MNLPWQILVPVPQYPLYSAAISLFGGSLVPYYLEEEANWGLDFVSIRQTVAEARSKGITVSVLWVIVLVKFQFSCYVIPAIGVCRIMSLPAPIYCSIYGIPKAISSTLVITYHLLILVSLSHFQNYLSWITHECFVPRASKHAPWFNKLSYLANL